MNGSRFLIFLCMLGAYQGMARADDGTVEDARRFQPMDVFQLEYASDPQISPDGKRVVYLRNSMDIENDGRRTNLWIVGVDGKRHRPLTSGHHNEGSPRWSPDGTRLLYVASEDGSSQIYPRWMDTDQTARLTQLTQDPDGRWIAFIMLVPEEGKSFVSLPAAPELVSAPQGDRQANLPRGR